MTVHAIWTVGGWSLVGALLGRAFQPVAQRLGGTSLRSNRPTAAVLSTSILFGLLAWRTGLHTELLAFSCVALTSVPLIAIDLAELRLPTRLIWPTCLVTLALLTAAAAVNHDGQALLRAMIGMLALPTVYLVLALATRGGFGSGDVRLAAVVGLVLAWRSWPVLAAGTMLALALACVTGLVRIALGRASKTAPIPYGPAMITGAFTVLVAP
jgi:leader peptidase (prepilin peptidase)/N-methyltransferase